MVAPITTKFPMGSPELHCGVPRAPLWGEQSLWGRQLSRQCCSHICHMLTSSPSPHPSAHLQGFSLTSNAWHWPTGKFSVLSFILLNKLAPNVIYNSVVSLNVSMNLGSPPPDNGCCRNSSPNAIGNILWFYTSRLVYTKTTATQWRWF